MSTELSKNSGVNFLDPDSFVNAQRVANMFIYSELVPETYRATPKKGKRLIKQRTEPQLMSFSR